MSLINGVYTNPGWTNDQAPALNATNLNDISNAIVATQTDVNGLRAAVGSPLVAATVAEMTDGDKVYVYTGSEDGYTAGNWYYSTDDGTTWTSGGVYNAVACDTALSASSTNAVRNAVVTGAITELQSLTTQNVSQTSSPSMTWTDGYYVNASGTPTTNTNYCYSNLIPVSPGDVITGKMRFVTAYKTTTATSYNDFATSPTEYTVSSVTNYVVISRQKIDKAYPLYIKHTSTENVSTVSINGLKTSRVGANSISATGSISGGNTISFATYHSRKGKSIAFYGKVSTLGTLTIGCGTSGINSAYFTVDDTNVVYYGANTAFNTTAHGLTIEGYIFILIDVSSENADPTITIYTMNGIFNKTYSYQWLGGNSTVFASGDSNAVLTDCELSFACADTKKPIWYFGDSYMSFRDPARLAGWLITANVMKNICSIGYAGASAADLQPDVLTLFGQDRYPHYLVYAIGMNNGDSGAVNATWKSMVDQLNEMCESLGIELILCTIPNTPNVDNQYKNDYVRASGLRYIDFASAVNTSTTGTEWVSGALSSDNTHPTAIGARLLASKLIADFPEICG